MALDSVRIELGDHQLYQGWGKDVLPLLATNSVDSIVTDPPYGLSKEPNMTEVLTHWLAGDDYTHSGNGFMGKSWDSFVPGPATWREIFRVLKPGGYALVFAGSRTVDLMGVSLRLAGFEIRDQIQWVYGSGFPKSLDISKALDKAAGAEREVVGREDRRAAFDGVERTSDGDGNEGYGSITNKRLIDLTAPNTPEAQQWQGWGTALKPAHEPIIVCRKPLIGTVAQNILTYGVGGLNIDGCRVGDEERMNASSGTPGAGRMRVCNQVDRGDGKTPDGRDLKTLIAYAEKSKEREPVVAIGRFPANLIHDGSDEVLALFPQTTSGGYPPEGGQRTQVVTYGKPNERGEQRFTSNSGSAARFFYAAKASKSDRGEHNNHPTVKPQALMRYLVRLVTPPGGIVLDSFAGSGSTGVAAHTEGFRSILVEQCPDNFNTCCSRVATAVMTETP